MRKRTKAFVCLSTVFAVALPVGFYFSALSKAPKWSGEKFCVYLDRETQFSRCETNEAICYSMKGGAPACWVKPKTEVAK